MGFANYIVEKLVGYDIFKSEDELKSSLDKAERKINTLNLRHKEATDNIASKNQKIEQLNDKITGLQQQVAQLTNNLDIKNNEVVDLTGKLEELNSQYKSKQGSVMNYIKKINTLTKENDHLKVQVEKYIHELEAMTVEKDALEVSKQELESKINSLTAKDSDPKNYNEINKNPRDSKICFDCDSHTYTFNGTVFKSVTTIVDECFEKFDADYWARKKAPSLGMTPQAVKDMWDQKGEEARNLGTQMHEKIERYYMGFPNSSDETYNLFCQFTEQYKLSPYRTEWAIYDEDSHVAGTLDFLNYQDGIFTIYDWKRSNKVIKNGQPEKVSRWRKHALRPISHIHDTTYWHYALQVSIYRYILEKNYGIKVASSYLAVFHPDYNQPYVVDVPYMKDEVITVLSRQ